MVMACVLDIILVVVYSAEDILYSVLTTDFSILSSGNNFSRLHPFDQACLCISFIVLKRFLYITPFI